MDKALSRSDPDAGAVPSASSVAGFDVAARWRAIDGLLAQGEALWRPRPFRSLRLPWCEQLPALAAWLLGLEQAQVEQFESDHRALCTALAVYVPALAQLPSLVEVPRTTRLQRTTPAAFTWEIAGRKWDQICALADCVEQHTAACGATGPLLDWCSGKGHLARAIALRTGRTVRGMERDTVLCAEGNRLARRDRLPVSIHSVDVMTERVEPYLDAGGHIVAMHACGRLHLRLLRLAVAHRAASVMLAPCCHHLCDRADTALSCSARASPLSLAPDELQLAVQETVTAGASRRRDRERESAWRLGFDLLQRDLRGVDDYLPVPSVPRALIRTSFTEFVGWAIARKQLPSPAATSFAEFERAGQRRHAAVTRLALLRHAFRRPLELRIVCDRALFLVEHGFTADVVEFCARDVTPRNLLIAAQRQ